LIHWTLPPPKHHDPFLRNFSAQHYLRCLILWRKRPNNSTSTHLLYQDAKIVHSQVPVNMTVFSCKPSRIYSSGLLVRLRFWKVPRHQIEWQGPGFVMEISSISRKRWNS
jgi:hypothetical protein